MGPELWSTAQARRCTPAYLLAMQALQVGDERLIDFLAPGDFRECHVCLAQQFLVWQLRNTEGELLEPCSRI